MITLCLNWRDFLCAVEGFAGGSHLRQHIWHEIVVRYIKQMDDLERDTLWFFFRRDIWPLYFESEFHSCGDKDFLQCMAAMHRGNYRTIRFCENGKKNGKRHNQRCYRFQNEWRVENSFTGFIPESWIVKVSDPNPVLEPLYIEQGKEHWWRDLEVYNTNPDDVRIQTMMEVKRHHQSRLNNYVKEVDSKGF